MCFFSRTMHIHIRLLRRNMLFMVYNCPGQQEPKISHQLNTYGTWWSGNLLSLQCLSQPFPNCDMCKMLGIITGWHSAPLWMFVCKNTCLHCCQRGLHCELMWLFGHPLLWHVSFIWSEFLIMQSHNDKLPVTSICNTMNLSLEVLHFFSGSVAQSQLRWVKWLSYESAQHQKVTKHLLA